MRLDPITDEQLEEYTFITTVYGGTDPVDLKCCLESMEKQTVPPDRVIVVIDGEAKESVKAILRSASSPRFEVVQLRVNVGPGSAAQAAINLCKTELIARLDADDISHPKRIEKQLRAYRCNRDLGSVGTFVIEKNANDGSSARVSLPVDFEGIKKYAKKRCPLRQSTLLIRKSAIDLVGGYSALRFAEDWDLYNRFIKADIHCVNVPEYLVDMKVDGDYYARRGGLKKLLLLIKFKWRMLLDGQTDMVSFFISSLASTVVCLVPNRLRELVYVRLLRR